jgi:hypothetical protein
MRLEGLVADRKIKNTNLVGKDHWVYLRWEYKIRINIRDLRPRNERSIPSIQTGSGANLVVIS